MTPEQEAAYINAQSTMALLELEALRAKNRVLHVQGGKAELLDLGDAKEYQDLADKYACVLGHNGVIGLFHGYNR